MKQNPATIEWTRTKVRLPGRASGRGVVGRQRDRSLHREVEHRTLPPGPSPEDELLAVDRLVVNRLDRVAGADDPVHGLGGRERDAAGAKLRVGHAGRGGDANPLGGGGGRRRWGLTPGIGGGGGGGGKDGP